jgi:hypothetical protein
MRPPGWRIVAIRVDVYRAAKTPRKPCRQAV